MWVPYAVGIGGTLAIALFRQSIDEVAGSDAPFSFFTIPIAIAAISGGGMAGLLATVISLVIGSYLFIPPKESFAFATTGGLISMIGSAAGWLVICGLGESLKRIDSAREKTRSELEETQVELSDILNRINDGFYTMDAEWNVTYANRALLDLVQRDGSQVIGRHFLEAFPYERNHELLNQIQQATNTGEFATLLTGDAETTGVFQLRIYPYPKPRIGYAILVQNVTAQKTIERSREQQLEVEKAKRTDAEQANRMKDELVATLSHELRTPLTAIVGWTEILQGRTSQFPEFHEAVDTIDRAARLQAKLVDDLLDMSRLVTGQLNFTFEVLDLAEVTQEVLNDMRLRIEESQRTVTFESEADSVYIRADSFRLSQTISNLISNALKFTHQNGRIALRLRQVNGSAILTVADDGIGIAPNDLPHIFEKFQQANSSITRQYGGLGLGLAIVKQLIEAQGGQVSAMSDGVGRGTTMQITLPTVAPLAESSEWPETPAGQRLLEGVRVLVVEDDDTTRHLLVTILEEEGAQVVQARDVDEGVALAATESPQLIVSDIGMPGQDGLGFVRTLRENANHVPTLALTAFANEEDRSAALAAGFNDYLVKPIRRAELISAIQRLLRRA